MAQDPSQRNEDSCGGRAQKELNGLDLQPTIDLIETSGSAIGILSLLDEECIMPKATGTTFTQKLQLWAGKVPFREKSHPGKEKYTPVRFEQGFIVKHYAGDVEY